jgi:hypothetical protein
MKPLITHYQTTTVIDVIPLLINNGSNHYPPQLGKYGHARWLRLALHLIPACHPGLIGNVTAFFSLNSE